MARDEGEQALHALLEAVALVTRVMRDRPIRRDALIAIEDANLRTLTERIIIAFGFQIYRADSAAEAAATAAGCAFDLIVLEAAPSALQAVQRLRALPAPLNAAPIISLGGVQPPSWREDAAEAGVDPFIPAPVRAARLIDVIVLLMGADSVGDEARREA